MIYICVDKRVKTKGMMPPRCWCGAYLSTTFDLRPSGKFFCKSPKCTYKKKREERVAKLKAEGSW